MDIADNDLRQLVADFEEKNDYKTVDIFNIPTIIMGTSNAIITTTSNMPINTLMSNIVIKLPNTNITTVITKSTDIDFDTKRIINVDRRKTFGPSISLHVHEGYKLKLFPPKNTEPGVISITLIIPGIKSDIDLTCDNKSIKTILDELKQITNTEWIVSNINAVLVNYKIEYKDPLIRMNDISTIQYLKNIPGIKIESDEKTIRIKIPLKKQIKPHKIKYAVSIQITGNFKFMIKLSSVKSHMLNNCIMLLNMIFKNKSLTYYPIT